MERRAILPKYFENIFWNQLELLKIHISKSVKISRFSPKYSAFLSQVFFYVTPIKWLFWNIFKIFQQDWPSLLRWLGEVVFWFFICLLIHRILVNSFFVCWKKLKKLCKAKIALSLHRDLKRTLFRPFSNTISSKNHVKWN